MLHQCTCLTCEVAAPDGSQRAAELLRSAPWMNPTHHEHALLHQPLDILSHADLAEHACGIGTGHWRGSSRRHRCAREANSRSGRRDQTLSLMRSRQTQALADDDWIVHQILKAQEDP